MNQAPNSKLEISSSAKRTPTHLRSLWRGIGSCLGAFFLTCCVHSAELPAAWKYSQPITLSQTGLVRFSVPLDTLDAARPGLEDLRIHDAAGREVPFDLNRPVQRTVLTSAPRKFSAKIETNTTAATLETGLAQPVVGVTLQTPARDFLKAVRVEGSSDGRLWATIADGQPAFVLTNGTAQLLVHFPAGLWPHLRVTLDDRRTAPIPITGITLHPESTEEPPVESVGIAITERTETERETRLTLRLAGGNLTLAGLSLMAADSLFSRRVTLAQRALSGGEVRETPIASGFLYRLALEGRPVVSNVTFAADVPVQSRELLLTIHNDGNPPLNVATVTAKRRPAFALLVNNQPGPLHLLSGNTQCSAPKYDLAGLPRDVRTVPLVAAQASPLTANPKFAAATPDPLAADPAPMDVSSWRFRKLVRLIGPGIQQLELDREVLARCATNLADLRIVTAGQAVPFILDRTPTPSSSPPTTRLIFRAAENSAPALLYGNIQAAPPRYAEESAAREIFSAPRVQATLGPEEELKGKPPGESLAGTKGSALFWGALAVAVAGLLFVLSRLLSKPAEPTK